jgi:peptidyl-prolyl cis-trans isomerase SurA
VKKYILIIELLSIYIFSIPSGCQEIIDGIVAIVGDEIILRSELQQTAQGYALQAGLDPITQAKEFEKLQKEILANMINEKVLLAKAKEDTIIVEDQQVEIELDSKIKYFIEQLGSKEKVEAYFGIPVNKIKKNYRDEVRKSLIVQKVQSQKRMGMQISRNQIERFYNTMKDSLPKKPSMVKLRHILVEIRAGSKSKSVTMERILAIQSRLANGEDFKELASLYSEDPGTAEKGGELGFVERGTFFKSFEEAAFKLEPGEISDIVETKVGLHLIQMIEKRGEKINVRHILIRLELTHNDEEDVIEELIRIRQRVLDGEDFDQLAKEFSADESSRAQGGDLGWLPLENLQIEAFKNVVDTIDVNQISMPFKTRFGYHIIKLEDKSLAGEYSLQDDWEQLKEWALNNKWHKIFNEWIENLKKNIYIEIKNNVL